MTAADLDQENRKALHRTILAAWRIEQPRLITSLARMLRDVPLAEDLTQEVLVAALEHWPVTGIPERPGAWLMASARNRALDQLRRRRILARKHNIVAADLAEEQQAVPDFDAALNDDIGDEMLRLIFTACHPVLSREARAGLALRVVCGLTTEEIARVSAAGSDRRAADCTCQAKVVGVGSGLRNAARRRVVAAAGFGS